MTLKGVSTVLELSGNPWNIQVLHAATSSVVIHVDNHLKKTGTVNGEHLKCSFCISVHLLYMLPTFMELLFLQYPFKTGIIEGKVVTGRSVKAFHEQVVEVEHFWGTWEVPLGLAVSALSASDKNC